MLGGLISSKLSTYHIKCHSNCIWCNKQSYTIAYSLCDTGAWTVFTVYRELRTRLSCRSLIKKQRLAVLFKRMEPTAHSTKKDNDLQIEKIQHRLTKMIINKESNTYEDRLKYLRLWTLEERRNWQDLIKLLKIFKGLSRVRIDELFILDENTKDESLFETEENSVHHGYH